MKDYKSSKKAAQTKVKMLWFELRNSKNIELDLLDPVRHLTSECLNLCRVLKHLQFVQIFQQLICQCRILFFQFQEPIT